MKVCGDYRDASQSWNGGLHAPSSSQTQQWQDYETQPLKPGGLQVETLEDSCSTSLADPTTQRSEILQQGLRV